MGSKFTNNALAVGALPIAADGPKCFPRLPSLFEDKRGREVGEEGKMRVEGRKGKWEGGEGRILHPQKKEVSAYD